MLVFGERKYAMRLWVDPKRLADNGLTAGDVVNALQAQNVQVAAGSIGAPPTNGQPALRVLSVRATGRLHEHDRSSRTSSCATTPDGGFVKVRDVGRVDARAPRTTPARCGSTGTTASGSASLQLQTGNALQVSQQVRATMDRLSAQVSRPAISYQVAFDTTEFVRESIKEVVDHAADRDRRWSCW